MSRLLSMVFSAAAMLAVSTNVFAQTTSMTKRTTFFEQGLPLVDSTDGKYKADPVPYNGYYGPAYAAPANVKVDSGLDLNVNASLLYWCFSQDAMDLAFVSPETANTNPDAAQSGSVVMQSFKYKPGFKVGIGYDTNFDNWALSADYTWFHATSSTSATGTNFSANHWFPLQDSSWQLRNATNLSSSWKLRMDQADLLIGRPFYQGTNLTVAPAGGLRALFLRQHVNIALSGGKVGLDTEVESGSSNTSSRSWAIGPKAGVNTKWLISNGFRIDTVMGASVLYTRYTTLANVSTDDTKAEAKSQNKNISALRPTLETGVGLGYSSYAYDNRLFFDAAVRYDFGQYWSQNMVRDYASQLGGHNPSNSDLALHGVTATLRCDF